MSGITLKNVKKWKASCATLKLAFSQKKMKRASPQKFCKIFSYFATYIFSCCTVKRLFCNLKGRGYFIIKLFGGVYYYSITLTYPQNIYFNALTGIIRQNFNAIFSLHLVTLTCTADEPLDVIPSFQRPFFARDSDQFLIFCPKHVLYKL